MAEGRYDNVELSGSELEHEDGATLLWENKDEKRTKYITKRK